MSVLDGRVNVHGRSVAKREGGKDERVSARWEMRLCCAVGGRRRQQRQGQWAEDAQEDSRGRAGLGRVKGRDDGGDGGWGGGKEMEMEMEMGRNGTGTARGVARGAAWNVV